MTLGALASTAFFVVTPAYSSIFDRNYAAMGAKLDQGMTEAAVLAILGHAPSSVSLSTCGRDTGKPWTCKVETFGRSYSGTSLTVYFQKSSAGIWLAASWQAE